MDDSHVPTFSIVMPSYNHAAYVAATIESVITQTFTDWELWIVDDGSTDGSAAIVDEWAAKDERIHALHQANAGPAAARNAGVARCRAQWIAFIDSDDVFYPHALQAYADFIAANPEATFIYGYRHRLNDDGSVTELSGEFQDRITGSAELFGRMYLSHLCVCYRRELLEKVGGYDERLRSVEDYDLYLRMSLHTRFWPIGQATGLRRRHETNLSRQTGYSRTLQAAVLQRFIDSGGRDVLDDALIHRRLGKIYYSAGRQYFKERCYVQAIDALGTALNLPRAGRGFSTFKAVILLILSHALVFLGCRDERTPPDL